MGDYTSVTMKAFVPLCPIVHLSHSEFVVVLTLHGWQLRRQVTAEYDVLDHEHLVYHVRDNDFWVSNPLIVEILISSNSHSIHF